MSPLPFGFSAALLALLAAGCSASAGSSSAPGAGGKGAGGGTAVEAQGGESGASGASGGGPSAGGTAGAGGADASGGAPAIDGGSAAGGSSGAGSVDLSGTWVSQVKTTGIENVPLVGQQNVQIDLLLRLTTTVAAGKLTAAYEVCRLNSVTFPDPTALAFTFTPAVLATLTETASEDAPPLSVGGALPLPALTIQSGIDAAGNSIDADHDNHDGVTVPTNVGNGWLKADGYIGFTIEATLTSTLTDASTLGGTADFSANGKIFGSTSPLLTSGTITVTPTSKTTPFSAQRLPGDVSCGTLAQQFPPS